MKILKKAFSHINYKKKKNAKNDWRSPTVHKQILTEPPFKIHSYQKLIDAVAQISFYNSDLFLFYRGQSKEFLEKGKPTLYPKIYRPLDHKPDLAKQFSELTEYEDQFIEYLKHKTRTAGTYNMTNYRELRWAIIQHYDRFPTPVLDVTHSLHVACSFALKGKKNEETGIIYLLGTSDFPKSITYSTLDELSIVRLSAFAAPLARRPYLQQAYSFCPFPLTNTEDIKSRYLFDFSRRVVARFEIVNTSNFWGERFGAIPDELLIPEKDSMDGRIPPSPIDIDAFWHSVSEIS